MTECFPVTNEVSMIGCTQYLIRIDNEEMAFASTLSEAKGIIDSLAAAEIKRLTKPDVQVFRQDTPDNNKIVISTQSVGYLYNGVITPVTTIDIVAVGKAKLVRPRLEIGSNIPIPPPLPTVNLYKDLPRRLPLYTEVDTDSDDSDDTSDISDVSDSDDDSDD